MFKESFKAKKDTVVELKKYNRDKSEQNLNRQINEIESIENYYKNKFDLLNAQMRKDKESAELRNNAQNVLATKMKSQIRNKLETDIRDLQEQMRRENEFLCLRKTSLSSRIKDDGY